MVALFAEVKEQSTFTVQWKRGPSKEETKLVDVDPYQGSTQINQSFIRYSQIYKDEKKGKYLKKTVRYHQSNNLSYSVNSS
jgi:hypothetical protein